MEDRAVEFAKDKLLLAKASINKKNLEMLLERFMFFITMGLMWHRLPFKIYVEWEEGIIEEEREYSFKLI